MIINNLYPLSKNRYPELAERYLRGSTSWFKPATTMPLSFVGAEREAKEWQMAQRDEN